MFAAAVDLEPLCRLLAALVRVGRRRRASRASRTTTGATRRGGVSPRGVSASACGSRRRTTRRRPAGLTGVRLHMGLAFGTGEHPTTALCLDWLDAHLARGATVLDYGCGSGVLAIAALALGARERLGDRQRPASDRRDARQRALERLHRKPVRRCAGRAARRSRSTSCSRTFSPRRSSSLAGTFARSLAPGRQRGAERHARTPRRASRRRVRAPLRAPRAFRARRLGAARRRAPEGVNGSENG